MTNNLVKTLLILAFSTSHAVAKSNFHYHDQHGYTHHHLRVKHRHHQSAMPQDDLTCVANTIYREARNSDSNLQAVANVAKNRLRRGWGDSYCQVIRTGRFVYQVRSPNPEDYSRAVEIARQVIEDELPDNTGGAVFFHAQHLRHRPKWAKPEYLTARIAGNVFYTDRTGDMTAALD